MFYLSRKRRSKSYKPLNCKELLNEKNHESNIDKLFKKIKLIEKKNRATQKQALVEITNAVNLVVGARNVLADPNKVSVESEVRVQDVDTTNNINDINNIDNVNGIELESTQKELKAVENQTIGEKLDESIKKAADTNTGGYNVVMSSDTKKNRSSIAQYNFTDEQENPAYYIASNKRLSKILEYRRILSEFIEMMKSVEDQHSYCRSKIVESDREIQDFLHELRQPKRNAYEGFKLYQLGHHLEIKRQGFKDADEDIFCLAKLANASKEYIEKLERIMNHLEDVKTSRENKIYMPRSDLDLPVGDKFRSLPKEEQAIICQNFEKTKAMYKNNKKNS